MKHLRLSFAFAVSAMLLLVFCCKGTYAQIPSASGPQKVGCANGVRCGETFTATNNGIIYDCICNCSGQDDCTPRSSSSTSVPGRQSEDNSAMEAEQERRQQEQEQKKQRKEQEMFEKAKNEAFTSDHENLMRGLKGETSAETPAGTPALKTGATALPLKGYGTSSAVVLKTGTATTTETGDNSPQHRQELLGNLSETIQKRIAEPNEQAQEIARSLTTNKPPSLFKNIASLKAGDVILVAPIPLKDATTVKGLWEAEKSQVISFADQWGSDRWNANASHAAIFLGERNGKRWYLNNTSEHGPVILEEREFLREYGERQMDVASYVGEPISKEQGLEIWKAAHELRNTKKYGIWAENRLVCSEACRWLLLCAGRSVPERQGENATIHGFDTHLNKKDFVTFTPADFYENQQYFVVQRLEK